MLPQFVVGVLMQHRIDQLEDRLKACAAWQESDIVFSNPRGGFIEPAHLLPRFQKLL
jgi:hypothetical protein